MSEMKRMLRWPTGQALVIEALTTVVFIAMLGTVFVTLSGVESRRVLVGRYENP